MRRVWDSIVQPLLEAAAAEVVVEIGADEGGNTHNLVDWCRAHDAALHVIDPVPAFEPTAWRAANGDVATLHLDRSLNALPRIDAADVVLVDGDHNHYTVLRELRLIAKRQPPGSGTFPLVLLHDIHWPYGRRDLYYDPDAIPEAHRQPYRHLGLRPDLAEPQIEGGFNAHLANAIYEHDLANGVLTAVEDFIAEADTDLRLLELPGLHGLGVLRDPASYPDDAPVVEVLGTIAPTAAQRVHLQTVERDRLDQAVTAREEKSARTAAEHAYREAKDDAAAVRDELTQARQEARRETEARRTAERDAQARRTELEAAAHEQASTHDELVRTAQALKEAEQARDALRAEVARQQEAANQRAAIADGWRRRARWLEAELGRIRGRKVVRIGLAAANSVGAALRLGQDRTDARDRQPPPRPAAPVAATSPGARPSASSDSPATTAVDGGPPTGVSDHLDVAEQGGEAGPERSDGTAAPRQAPPAHANIIIPVHDALDDVRRCLASVVEHTNLRVHKLIIVDDGSGPDTAAALRDAAAGLGAQLIRRDEAGGFSVACTAGIDASWLPAVVLLNSDTIVGPDWLERMLACAQSDPAIGVVGPWSNAASWQSIPEVVDADGSWSTNPDIDPADVPAINERLGHRGARIRPHVPLINGFCYLVTRKALDAVGGLDVASFPRGYGEEDDLSIRVSQAGFTAAIADDCFVYHAKSRSYSSQQRDTISKDSQKRLIAKHGEDAITSRTREMRLGRDMVRARAHAALQVADEGDRGPGIPGPGPSVAWLQPHLRPVGGIRRAVEMTNRLAAAGWDVTLVSLDDGDDHVWLPRRAPAVKLAEAAARSFDVVLVSDPDVLWALDSLDADRAFAYHLDAYHLYRERGVEDFYAFARKVSTNLANSPWTASLVGTEAGVEIDAIIPGAVDLRQFTPRPAAIDHDVICYGSRRPRKRTALVDDATSGLRLGKLVELSVSQGDLSWQYSRGRVFVSASSQEGFNLPCLEAMACGVPVVCTDDGGSGEYVVDGHNALVVDSDDPADLRAAIDRVLDDDALAARLIEAGLETATRRDWNQVTAQLAKVLSG